MRVLTCGTCNATNQELRDALKEAQAIFEAIRQVSHHQNVRAACEKGVDICKRHERKKPCVGS